MKIRFEPDMDKMTFSRVHGEYTTDGEDGWRSVDVYHPALGSSRYRVRVSDDDMDVMDDNSIIDRIRQEIIHETDESDAPDLARKIRSKGPNGYVTADGGDYTLV